MRDFIESSFDALRSDLAERGTYCFVLCGVNDFFREMCDSGSVVLTSNKHGMLGINK